MKSNFSHYLAVFVLWTGAVCFGDEPATAKAFVPPVYRIEVDGFETREADLRPLLDSVCRELWPHFPDYQIEPMVITRGRSGPIVLYNRNDRGELVVKLDSEKTYWAQYSYQFAHEFCHVLCGFRGEGYRGNLWFEETLCETSSLYCLRAMARTWNSSPPFPNWRDFRDLLRSYVDDIQKRRTFKYEIYSHGMATFYQSHRAALEKNPGDRDLNGAMALVLLQLFEEHPEHWESIRWLNATEPGERDSFAVYLQKWHSASPRKHQPFVEQVAKLYGISVSPVP